MSFTCPNIVLVALVAILLLLTLVKRRFRSSFSIALVTVSLSYYALPEPSADVVLHYVHDLNAIAHRGGGIDAPENTLAAFQQAILHGANAVELDLTLTKDGIGVLMHDETLERTTNGVGFIRNTTLENLRKLNASYKFFEAKRQQFENETIPLFETVVQLCLEHNMKIIIDLKTGSDEAITLLMNTFEKYPKLYSAASVLTENPLVGYWIRQRNHNILIAYGWCPGYVESEYTTPHSWQIYPARLLDTVLDWLVHHVIWRFTGARLIVACRECISPSYVDAWKRRGLHVIAYTVNDRHEKLHYLHTLNCPFLTDSIADVEHVIRQLVKP